MKKIYIVMDKVPEDAGVKVINGKLFMPREKVIAEVFTDLKEDMNKLTDLTAKLLKESKELAESSFSLSLTNLLT